MQTLSSVIPGMTKSILEKAPEGFKSKLIEEILEEILKDPELLKKFRNENNKSKSIFLELIFISFFI